MPSHPEHLLALCGSVSQFVQFLLSQRLSGRADWLLFSELFQPIAFPLKFYHGFSRQSQPHIHEPCHEEIHLLSCPVAAGEEHS